MKKLLYDSSKSLQSKTQTSNQPVVTGLNNNSLSHSLSSIQFKKENNTGLPDNLKSGIENLSGYSMDDVKVHYNSSRPTQLQAHAYTQGTDIHVASGQEKHLAHEAWHVVQQKQGRVQATTQMHGVNVNDNSGLEKEADVMGAKAMNSSSSIQRKSTGLKETDVSSNEPVQKYAVARNTVDRKLYNISENAKMICGVDYPNHELFVKNSGMINTLNNSIPSGLIEFKSNGKYDVSLDGKTKVQYEKVYPEYKNNHEKLSAENSEKIQSNSVDVMKNELGVTNKFRDASSERAITKVNTLNESMRKTLTQLMYKHTDIQELKEVHSDVVEAYQAIHSHIEKDLNKSNTRNALTKARETVDSAKAELSDQHAEVGLMLGEISNKLAEMSTTLNAINSRGPNSRRRAYVYDHEQYAKQKENLLLPRGCDLVASTTTGRTGSNDTDDGASVVKFQVSDSSAHHYATKIFKDGGDFTTIEGFADGRYPVFDKTWEFIMHGNGLSIEAAFKKYTQIRYSFFPSFKKSTDFPATTRHFEKMGGGDHMQAEGAHALASQDKAFNTPKHKK